METGRHWFKSPSLQVCSFAELVMDAPQAGLDITRCNEQMTCAGLGFCRAWWCKEGPCWVSGNSCLQGSVGIKTWTASQPLLHHVLHHLPTSFHYLIAKNASLHLCITLNHFWIIFESPDISFDPFGRVKKSRGSCLVCLPLVGHSMER